MKSKVVSTKSAVQSSTKPSVDSIASVAMKAIDDIESKLDLDIVVRPNDKNQIRAATHVSPAALRLAADIVGAAPERFPEFLGIADDTAYVETMLPLANRALELATHIQKSIQNRHAPAAQRTLALYSVVKGLGRLADNETMREKVELLKAEVAPRRTKPKLTNEEKAVRKAEKSRKKRLAKALQAVVNNSDPVTASPAATQAAPGPTAAAPKTVVAPSATSSSLAN